MTSIPALRINGQTETPTSARILSLPTSSWQSRIARLAAAPPTLPQNYRGLSLVQQTHQRLSAAASKQTYAASLTALRDRVAALAAAMLLLLAAN